MSAALVVLCAGLLVANFLLPRLQDLLPSPAVESSDGSPPISDVAAAPEGQRQNEPSLSSAQPTGTLQPDGHSRMGRQKGESRAVQAKAAESKNNSALPKARAAELNNNSALQKGNGDNGLVASGPTQNPKSEPTTVIRPLGIVEKGDGRVEAVIPAGDSIELVEEGQVLADNSRVIRVSNDSVELAGPTEEPKAEVARAEPPAASHPAPEATKRLGDVEFADGRVETIVADGQWWVTLAPDSTKSDSAGVQSSVAVATVENQPVPKERQILAHRPEAAALPQEITEADLDLPHSVGKLPHQDGPPEPPANVPAPEQDQPIGLVEWADGRRAAVLAGPDSVRLVADAEIVDSTTRFLADRFPGGQPIGELSAQATGPPTEEKRNEMVALGEVVEENRPPPDPERGEALGATYEALTAAQGEVRPAEVRSPSFYLREDNLWEAELPGLEEVANASQGNVEALRRPPLEMNYAPKSSPVGSVPSRVSEESNSPRNEPKLSVAVDGLPQVTSNPRLRVVRPIGVIEWPKGRVRAAISVGDSVRLVEAGQVLNDGSRVVEVTAEAVTIQPSAEVSSPATSGFAGDAIGPDSHLMTESPNGSQLILDRPVHDN